SLITLAIAAVGTAAVLIGGGFALYTYEALRDASARDTGHVIVAAEGYFDHDEDKPMQYGMSDYADLRARLLRDPRVRAVLPHVALSGLISNGDKSAVVIGRGLDPGDEFHVKGPFLKVNEGGVLSPHPEAGAPPEILLGSDLARSMNAHPGTGLTLLSTTTEGALNAIDVQVKGLVSVGVPDIDKRLVLVTLATAQSLLLTDKVSSVSVHLYDTAQTDAVAADIAHGPLSGALSGGQAAPRHSVQTWLDQAFFYQAVRALYNRIFGLLGAIIVMIVAFSVFNTIAMAVVERTREIGTLRALGALPSQIIGDFALEGLVIGTAGAVIGALLCGATSMSFDALGVQMPPPPGRSEGYPLHINLDPGLLVVTLLLVVALSIAAAWFASRRAANRPIVEALTHV
ncbi:MAG TPA: FtsX-like permease family protein, partial [Burkholderiaceae bacterium]